MLPELSFIPNRMRKSKFFLIGIVVLEIINLMQSGFTQLLDDESYYWMYSQHPAFGYYDHPPMVAWLIGAGWSIFHCATGVRLGSVAAIGLCAVFLYKLQRPFNPARLIVIFLSVAFMQFGGFLAAPDVPLVLFSAMYLFQYRKYLDSPTWRNSILLGVCMAAVLYSKYTGILLLGFTVVAHLRILREKKFLVAISIGILLLLPHIYWQYIHGFPSLQYDLADRYAADNYKLSYSTDYILSQLFLFGPLIGWMFFYAAWRAPAVGDTWIRTLKWIVWGVTGFFLISSLKGRVEPNWTVIAVVPAILLLHNYLDRAPRLDRLLRKLFPYTLVLFLTMRAALVWNIFGDRVAINVELHDNRLWTSLIKSRAGMYPVYFVNSYQMASKYNYYQRSPATSYNDITYRNNQYDFWRLQSHWQQDSILVVSIDRRHVSADSIVTSQGKLYMRMFANPAVGADSLYRHLRPQKIMVPFLVALKRRG
jgi:hypothetical protein